MGHVAVCVHHRFPGGSLGSQSSCPCSLPAPAVVLTGLSWGWLAWGGCWPRCPGSGGGCHAGPVMPPFRRSQLPEPRCWQHEVPDAGLGLSQGPSVSRHPQSAAHIAPARAGLGPASRRQSPVSLSSAGDPSCSEFPVPSASSQARSTFLSLPAGQEGFLFPLLGLV